jgi:hypothetical protein
LITTVTEFIALQAVGHVIISEDFLVRIESGYSLLSAEPKPANSIFPNATNRAARQALALRVPCKASIFTVEPIKSVKPSCPECSSPVFVDSGDAAAIQSVKVT